MIEEFRVVPGYEGLYEVSNLGKVRRNGKILKPSKNNWGYLRVNLYKNGIMKSAYIHRLVAQTFLPNPQNLPMINHKDEDKTNNSIDNLEWCTAGYNNSYGTRIKRVVEKNSKPVLQYDFSGKFIKEFSSVSDAAEEIGVSLGTLSGALTGQQKTSKGYLWKYKN